MDFMQILLKITFMRIENKENLFKEHNFQNEMPAKNAG